MQRRAVRQIIGWRRKKMSTLREPPPAHSEALPMKADGRWKEETHLVEQSGQGEEFQEVLSHLGGYLGAPEACLELWGSFGGYWGHRGAMLGHRGAPHGALEGIVGSSWGYVGTKSKLKN